MLYKKTKTKQKRIGDIYMESGMGTSTASAMPGAHAKESKEQAYRPRVHSQI